MAKWGFPDMSAEVERLRVELEQARERLEAEERECERLREIHVSGGRGDWRDKLADWISGGLVSYWHRQYVECAQELDFMVQQNGKACVRAEQSEGRADRLQAERDDLAARLQQIQQAERKYTAAKLAEAAKMRKGQAI